MKRRATPLPGQAVNITPLSDIMLSLLIFFMLVSKKGVETGADPELELPIAVLGVTQEEFDDERAATSFLVVNVRSSSIPGNPRVYGKYILSGDPWEFTVRDPQSDADTLQRFITEFKNDRDDFQVQIHAGSTTPFFDIEAVLKAVVGADVAGVKYAFDQPR